MMPVPRVSVRKRERKPMSPRDGTENSRRTRLEPGWIIFVILPLRTANSCETTPIKSSGNIDDQQLHGFVERAVDLAGDDGGLGHLQLVAFPPHGLDDDRELEFAAARDLKGVRLFGIDDAEADVLFLLVKESLSELARGHEFSFASGPGRIVRAENHRDGGLVDAQGWKRLRILAVGDGIADADVLNAGDSDDVAGLRRSQLNAL